MSATWQSLGTPASLATYRARSQLRESIERGSSLALLIEAREATVERMIVNRLVRWEPFLGPVKAERMLMDLPGSAQVRQLTESQRRQLVARLRAFEDR